MDEQEIKELMISTVEKEVAITDIKTHYRQPLIGFAEAKIEDFQRLRKTVGEHHILPDDLLPGAQSLVTFFLPFSEEVVRANRASSYIAREWAIAYVETNKLISHICEVLG